MTLSPFPRLDTMLDDACTRHADRVAVIDDLGPFSYRDLAAQATRLGRDLRAASHAPGMPVVVHVENQASDIACQLAAWRVGAPVVPVHRSSPSTVLRSVADRAGAALVLGDPAYLPAPWRDLTAEVPGTDGWVRRLPEPASPPAQLDPDQALVAFTSGSTGRPKGVVLSHRAFAGKLSAIDEVLTFGPGTNTLHVLQLNFTFGQWTALLTLAKGGTLHMVARFDPAAVLARLGAAAIDRTAVVPSMLRMLVRALEEPGQGEQRRAAVLRSGSPGLWISGGEPLTAGLGRKLRTLAPHAAITDVFGLSETSTSDFILSPEHYGAGAGTIGRPSPGVSFRVVAPDGRTCPDGEPGELWIDTPYLMTGYLADPDSTAAALHEQWFRTGDLARVRPEDGLLELVGRSKQLISRGGVKISPLEVENCFASHPHCTECVAVGLPDPVLGERIHLLVVARGRSAPDRDDIRAWGRERMEPFKIPDQVHLIDEMPTGRTGKLDRTAARRLAADAAGISL